jgi:hypothetical protein
MPQIRLTDNVTNEAEDDEGASHLVLITESGDDEERYSPDKVDRNSEQLSIHITISHAPDDGWHECSQSVQRDIGAELDGSSGVSLPTKSGSCSFLPK